MPLLTVPVIGIQEGARIGKVRRVERRLMPNLGGPNDGYPSD